MKDRAKFFGLDKTEGFKEFEEKYLKSAENVQTGGNIYDYLKRYEKRNEQATAAYKKIAAADDIEAIAKTSGMSTADIKQIKQHVFFETHQLYDGVGKFEPDYDMAVAWQRLTEGHPEERDILLLRHPQYRRAADRVPPRGNQDNRRNSLKSTLPPHGAFLIR